MTKQEAKENFGKIVESPIRFEKRFESGHDSRQWVPIKKPITGVLIGVRTHLNGNTDYGDGCHFTMIDHFQVALIVPGWRNKPVPVPLEDCCLMEATNA